MLKNKGSVLSIWKLTMDGANIGRFGAFELNLNTGELRKSGVRVRLQDQPFQVLAALLANPGELVTREELQKRLWPDAVNVDFDQGLNKAVNKLRSALSDSADNPRFVETLARRGYRFVAPVIFPELQGAGVPVAESPVKPLKKQQKQKHLPSPALPGTVSSAGPPESFEEPQSPPALPAPVVESPLASFRNSGALALGAKLAGNPLPPPPAGRKRGSLRSTAWLVAAVGVPVLIIGTVLVVIALGLQSLKAKGEAPSATLGAGSASGVVERWSLAESRFVPLEPALSGDGVTFTADGELVAFVAYPSAQLFVMRKDGSATTALAPGVFERTYTPAWSPDGQRLAFAGWKPEGPWKVYIVNRDGSGLRAINPGPGTEADPTWSPDGETVALAPFPWETRAQGTGIFLADMDAGAVRQIPESRGRFSPRWSPDGRYLAALTEDDSRLAIYEFATQTWSTVSESGAVHPVWDRRGSAVYFLRADRVQRFVAATGKLEVVLSVDGMDLRSNSPFGDRAAPWVGLNAQDEVLVLRAR